MGFKIAISGNCQNSQLWCTRQFRYPFGWFFGTQKGIKTDSFQNRKVWGHSKLAIVVHQQFCYLFGCFQQKVKFSASVQQERPQMERRTQNCVFPVKRQRPNGKNINLHKKWGFRRFKKECRKVRRTAFFAQNVYKKCRQTPHFLCRLMFWPFGFWGSTGNTQTQNWGWGDCLVEGPGNQRKILLYETCRGPFGSWMSAWKKNMDVCAKLFDLLRPARVTGRIFLTPSRWNPRVDAKMGAGQKSVINCCIVSQSVAS